MGCCNFFGEGRHDRCCPGRDHHDRFDRFDRFDRRRYSPGRDFRRDFHHDDDRYDRRIRGGFFGFPRLF